MTRPTSDEIPSEDRPASPPCLSELTADPLVTGPFLSAIDTRTLGSERGTPSTPPIVPGYEILSELGRGGMGVVYLARQAALDREVALKMILAGGHASASAADRFRAEASAVARLQHPNIVQVFEVGEADGRPYFSLEFVPGGTLAGRIAGTPLPIGEAAAMARSLAGAMNYAHERGVIHRDLKPANVLLAIDGTPKVTDFGLARMLGDDSGHTHTGQVLGTPSYMAPEQAAGEARGVGPLADVWALGAILYEMLTGRPPFKGGSVLDTLDQVRSRDPVPPSALNPAVPRDLETVCLKCLQKDARKRYVSAGALAEDLERFQVGRPVHARPVGRAGRAIRWVRRNPTVTILLAGVFLSLAAGVVGVYAKYLDAEYQAGIARVRQGQAESASEEKEKARADEAFAAAAARISAQTAARERDRADQQLARTETALTARAVAAAHSAADTGDFSAGLTALHQCRWDLRSWEWRQAWARCRVAESRQFLPTPQEVVAAVSYSRDGRRLACGTVGNNGSGELRIWDIETAEIILAARVEHGAVRGITFHPDGRRVAVATLASRPPGTSVGAIEIWDLTTHQQIRSFPVVGGAEDVAFSPDGRSLAAATVGMIRVMDANTGVVQFNLPRSGRLNGISFSPDGRRLATAGPVGPEWFGLGEVTVWDLATQRVELHLGTHLFAVRRVAFSPDGRRLAAGGMLADVKTGRAVFRVVLWDTATGVELQTLLGHDTPVMDLCFAPDGRRLLSCSSRMPGPTDVRLWDLATGKSVRTWSAVQSVEAPCLAFHPDGTRFVTGGRTVEEWNARLDSGSLVLDSGGQVSGLSFSKEGARLTAAPSHGTTARVWDARTGRELLTVTGDANILAVALSPDGQRLAVSQAESRQPVAIGLLAGAASADILNKSPTVFIWDVDSGRIAFALPRSAGAAAQSIAFSPDGGLLAAHFTPQPDGRGSLVVWDLSTRVEIRAIATAGRAVEPALAFSPDGRRIAVGEGDRSVRVSDIGNGTEARVLAAQYVDGSLDRISGLAFSRDGKQLAAGRTSRNVVVWDVESGKEVMNPQEFEGKYEMTGVSFSPDGRRLAAGGDAVRLWDVDTGQEAASLPVPGGASWVTFSPDGQRLAAAAGDGIHVWSAHSGPVPLPMVGHTAPVMALAFSPDGRRFASGSLNNAVRVWDARTGKELLTSRAHTGGVRSLAFSPDGKKLASGSQDKSARILDLDTGQVIASLQHPMSVFGIAYSPDGTRLATTSGRWNAAAGKSDGGEIVVWDTATWQPVHRLAGHANFAMGVAFSPDGKLLATGGTSPAIQLWDAQTGAMKRAIEGPQGLVSVVSFTPNGRTLVAGSGGLDHQAGGHVGDLFTWDLVEDRSQLVAPRTVCGLVGVGGHLVASGLPETAGTPGLVIRDLDAGTVIGIARGLVGGRANLSRPDPRVNVATVSPDGRLLVATDAHGQMQAWPVAELRDAATIGAREKVSDDEESGAWHVREASAAERDGDWFAAAFHLDRLIKTHPRNGLLHRRRGRVRAEHGEWVAALADFGRAISLDPSDWRALGWQARLALFVGDRRQYQSACAALFRCWDMRAGEELRHNWELRYEAAQVFALAPDAGVNLQPVAKWAEQQIPTGTTYDQLSGSLLLRLGRVDDALARLRQGPPSTWPVADLRLALTYRKAQNPIDAAKHLDLAKATMDQSDLMMQAASAAFNGVGGTVPILGAVAPRPKRPAPGANIPAWLEWQILRREAEQPLLP